MMRTSRFAGLMLLALTAGVLVPSALTRVAAQDQAPNRREFTISARDYKFQPERIEVQANDLVKLTVRSDDVAYGFTIDRFRVSKRVPAGGAVTFEFRVDSGPGTYPFYSNMTSDPRHAQMRGEIVVR
jgi:heme/copper-type cytochrome/quinol oxidase subunit 2